MLSFAAKYNLNIRIKKNILLLKRIQKKKRVHKKFLNIFI